MANKAKENKSVIVLSNNKELYIKPTKLKYFSNGDYAMYQFFEKHGAENIIVTSEGRIIALKLLSAIFDKAYKSEQVEVASDNDSPHYETKFTFDEALEKLYDEEITLQEFNQIISVSKEVNGIAEKN